MSDQEYSGQLYPSEDQDCDNIPIISDHHWSLWHHQNGPTSPSFCMEEVDHEAAHYSNILNDLSRFEVPSSLPLQELNPGTDIPCSKDIILNSLEKGQFSGTKRKHASDFICFSCESPCFAIIMNLRINQMMSIGAGYSTFHSPLMMMPQGPQPGLQGFQIPNLAPFSGMFSSFNFPMSQLGLPNPCLLPSSSATSGLPAPGGISAAAAHSIQNPGNFLEPLNLTSSSSMDWTSLYETSFHSSGSQSTSPSSRGRFFHLNKEVKDYGPSRSGSTEWFFFYPFSFLLSMKSEFVF